MSSARIAVVCTDRGQHPSRIIGWLTNGIVEQWDTTAGVAAMPQSTGTRTLDCRTCRRHIEWRPETAKRISDTLNAAGVTSADVSTL